MQLSRHIESVFYCQVQTFWPGCISPWNTFDKLHKIPHMPSPFMIFVYVVPLVVNALHRHREFVEFLSGEYQSTSCNNKALLLVSYTLIVTCFWCMVLTPPRYFVVAVVVNSITLLLLFISWYYKEPLSQTGDEHK